jgi:hypothetical protein
MVVDMSLAEMLLFEILMRGVRVPEHRMIVLVLMRGAQVLEGTGLMAAVVGHVEVSWVCTNFSWSCSCASLMSSPLFVVRPRISTPAVALVPVASSF